MSKHLFLFHFQRSPERFDHSKEPLMTISENWATIDQQSTIFHTGQSSASHHHQLLSHNLSHHDHQSHPVTHSKSFVQSHHTGNSPASNSLNSGTVIEGLESEGDSENDSESESNSESNDESMSSESGSGSGSGSCCSTCSDGNSSESDEENTAEKSDNSDYSCSSLISKNSKSKTAKLSRESKAVQSSSYSKQSASAGSSAGYTKSRFIVESRSAVRRQNNGDELVMSSSNHQNLVINHSGNQIQSQNNHLLIKSGSFSQAETFQNQVIKNSKSTSNSMQLFSSSSGSSSKQKIVTNYKQTTTSSRKFFKRKQQQLSSSHHGSSSATATVRIY